MTRVSDLDAWLYFEAPEPEHIRLLLDALARRSPARGPFTLKKAHHELRPE